MQRFWEKVDKTDTCWLWTAAKDPLGYGRFWLDGRMQLAHRVSLALSGERLNDTLDIDHLCRNPSCVHPWHLEQVTHRVNIKRGRLGSVTHCPRGHAYEGYNLMVSKTGGRKCRACHNLLRSQRNKQGANT